MKNKGSINFFFAVITLVVANGLYKSFDAATRTFEKPAIAALYAITLIGSVYALVREYRNGPGA